MSADFRCASAMWSDERETPGRGLAGSGWVDRGEDLVLGIFRESDRLGNDGGSKQTRTPGVHVGVGQEWSQC